MFTKSNTASRAVLSTKCGKQSFPCKQDVYQKNISTQQITESDFVSGHIYARKATNQDLYTERVKACQSECASPGGGEITEERHGAAGCQSKDLYRAVAAAETDIGRHGMHDKSWWTGGTRLKKQENTVSGAEGGMCQSGTHLLSNLEKR